jgi:benzodiazapine receptor
MAISLAHSPRDARRRVHWLQLTGFVIVTVGAGTLVGTTTGPSDWYHALHKAPGNPPGWVFGPVWTCLYVMIGVAGYLLWRARPHQPSRALTAWMLQLGFNLAWTLIFFGAKRPGWALADIVALLLTLLLTIRRAAFDSRRAMWLLLPYLAWVGFATYLTGYIVANN